MENIDIYNKKVDELSNANSRKREYVKGIEMIKKEEPEADGVDYYEDYETLEANDQNEMVTVTKQRFVEVPKPHKAWEEKLANHQAGYTATLSQITTLRDEIDTLEATLIG